MKTIDFLVKEFPALGGFPEGAVEAGFLSSDDTLYFVDANGDCPTEWRREGITAEIDDPWVEVSREQYESALTAKNDGWIEWGGGECPMDSDAIVDVKLKGGVQITDGETSAARYYWDHMNQRGDIIAYRLHQPTKSEQVRADAWNAYAGITELDDDEDLNECIGQAPVTEWNGEGLPPVGCRVERSFYNNQFHECEIVAHSLSSRVPQAAFCDIDGGLNGWGTESAFRPIRSEAERKRYEAVQAICDAGGGFGKVDEKSEHDSSWFDIYDAIAAGEIPGVKLED